jgi:hypothetical protein
MSASSQQRTVRWLCRFYSVMLFAYPVGLRQRYSREMAVVFRDQVRDVMELGGGWALAPFMLRVIGDWFHTTLQENADMSTQLSTLRWFAALPLAILAGAVPQTVLALFITPFPPVWILGTIAFLMAAGFVTVGVLVVPSRKDSVARIALGVVVFWAAASMALGAFNWRATPLIGGGCILLGGVVAYLPWRFFVPSSNRVHA